MSALPATVAWIGGIPGALEILDQTRLPLETRMLRLDRVEQVFDAIRRLAVRGAPAIGVAGAYGLVVGIQGFRPHAAGAAGVAELLAHAGKVGEYLKSSRPTAVNLGWAVDEVLSHLKNLAPKLTKAEDAVAAALERARAIDADDRERCERIGRHGASLLRDGDTVYTHCNAGALATAGIGTALGVMYAAAREGKRLRVFADETRPLLQGSRLTAYELHAASIPVTVVCDNMASRVMQTHKIAAVFVGADRIARNGDAANKIGTCGLAIIAKHYGVPFYVVAPLSTFDFGLADGSGIPIEERAAEEVTEIAGVRMAPPGVGAFNPAFDVTPASLITGIVTEAGIASPPTPQTVENLVRRG